MTSAGEERVRRLEELTDFLRPLYVGDNTAAIKLAADILNGEVDPKDFGPESPFTGHQIWYMRYLAAGHVCPDCGGDCEGFFQMMQAMSSRMGDA